MRPTLRCECRDTIPEWPNTTERTRRSQWPWLPVCSPPRSPDASTPQDMIPGEVGESRSDRPASRMHLSPSLAVTPLEPAPPTSGIATMSRGLARPLIRRASLSRRGPMGRVGFEQDAWGRGITEEPPGRASPRLAGERSMRDRHYVSPWR